MKYKTYAGVPCTDKESALIDSLKRLAKRWEKDGWNLMLFSANGVLTVLKGYDFEPGTFNDCVVEIIHGINNDGGTGD